MPYAGKTLMQREGVALIAPHWPNQKVKGSATMIAESHMSVGAWHDNIKDGEITSRDCGLFEINIPADAIGGQAELHLRTESLDPADYMDIAAMNVQAAYEKWNSPMKRPAGQPQKRLWQPWVAYTSGWATYPEAWVWSRVDPETGQLTDEPHGPWKIAGRYLHQAIRAVANWHLLIAQDLDEKAALAEAERLASDFKVTKGDLVYDKRHAVYWRYPPAPTEPPIDAAMGYPVRNDGR